MAVGTQSVQNLGGRLKPTFQKDVRSEASRVFRPSSEARVVFFRSLAVMFRAGVPVERSLTLLAEQLDDPEMSAVAELVSSRVRNGHYLSNSMAACKGAFTGLQLRLVHIAEASGTMDETLLQLSHYEERHRAMVMKVKSAITYPAFTFGVAMLMMITIPPYLMEGIFNMVTGLGQELPLLTKIVMAGCSILRSGWFYLLGSLALVAAWFGLPKLFENEKFALRYTRFVLRIPCLGETMRTVAVARFVRALAVQLSVGISPIVALSLAGKASDNPVLEQEAKASIEALKDGCTLEESMSASGFFPTMVLQMVRAGEESGQVADMLDRLAEIYEVELENTLDILTALLEPMVMVFMGVVVGVLVVSTMSPLMKVIQTL